MEKHGNPADTCDKIDCDEPTPWDMPAVVFHGEWYCCPDCARAVMETVGDVSGRLVYHDPQFNTDRATLPGGVAADDVDIHCEVAGFADAADALAEIEQMYSGAWRV